MKKKDPVLWVVVDRRGIVECAVKSQKLARDCAAWRSKTSGHAPFRVVKYVHAPKTKRKRKA